MGATGRAPNNPTNEVVAGSLRKTSAIGTIGRCWIEAPGIRVAPVFGTRVTVIAVDEVLAAIAIIANIVRALDAVVAVLVGRTLRRLFADAVNTDAGNAVPFAGVTFRIPRIGVARTAAVAEIIGALDAVVAVLVGRTLRLHFAASAQTNTGNAIGLAGCSVVHVVAVARPRGAHTIVTTAVRAFVVVAVVADLPLPWKSFKHAQCRINDANVVRAFILVVAVLVGPTFRLLFATSHQRNHAQRADT
jgi:hypothetical protein